MGTNRAYLCVDLVSLHFVGAVCCGGLRTLLVSSHLMKFIIGTKAGMTQVFDENGVCKAATILKVEPAKVSQVKNVETDGYVAVQIATGSQKDHRVSKAQKGHFGTGARFVKEFRPKVGEEASLSSLAKDSTFDAGIFAPGDIIAVSAISKGKGFQGVIKRHGFAGGSRSHGQKHSEREPGSIGATGFMRVIKGTRMGGRMGSDTITIKNLEVLQVNPAENILLVSGAIPGRKGTLVEVRGI
jgi:large subunit ribosomal protein L3